MASLTLEEVQQHRSKDDLWIIHENKVYEVTDFAGRHPGGIDLILNNGAQEISHLMQDGSSHTHSQFAYQILNKFYIGELIDNNNEPKHLKNGVANGAAHKTGRGTVRPPSETSGKTMLGWREKELVDWDKPLLWQVGKLGKDYLEWVHAPVDKHVRLFESNFLEYFADNPWWMIPLIWMPVDITWIYFALSSLVTSPDQVFMKWCYGGLGVSAPMIIPAFIYGMLMWSLFEYTVHRWLFHLSPPDDSPFLITFHFLLHGQHHKAPFDKYRLVFPPSLTTIPVFLCYTVAHSLLPVALAYGLLSGMMFGYVCYDVTHYYLHHGKPFLSYFKGLKQYHIKHHFINQQKGYGISSKLWDYPFDTLLPDDNITKKSH